MLASVLAGIWDFDSDIATPKLNATQVLNAPIRAYYQAGALPSGAATGSVLINAAPARWQKYVERGASEPAEVPPLPPERSNSNTDKAHDGHDTPRRAPPVSPSLLYTHHLIRDFMFLDATANNAEASGPSTLLTPTNPQEFTVSFLQLNPATFAGEDSALPQFTRGTGPQLVNDKHLLAKPVSGTDPFDFIRDASGLSFKTMLYQLVDLRNNPIDGNQSSPNWFGVAVPAGITDFTNVILYFHPTPGQANYKDADYASKTNGGASTHANWKELLGYVDRLGSQLAGAIKNARATPNQVVIVPLMRNSNLDGGASAGAGILPRQWYYIVNDILRDLPKHL